MMHFAIIPLLSMIPLLAILNLDTRDLILMGLAPLAYAVGRLRTQVTKLNTVVLGNGKRGLAGDVKSNRRHIDDLEKKFIGHEASTGSSDGNGDLSPAEDRIICHAARAAIHLQRMAAKVATVGADETAS